jgi:ATP-dependent Lon protease
MKTRLPVIPVRDKVFFGGSELQIHLNDKLYNELYDQGDEDKKFAIALTIKEHSDNHRVSVDQLYKIGNLIEIGQMSTLKNRYLAKIKVVGRVEAFNFEKESGLFYAEYESLPDLNDLDEKTEKDILGYIKRLTDEISESIKGSEAFALHIKQIDSVDEMMTILVPFINLSIDEQQGILEMQSKRKKSLKFLDVLIERKEQLKLQFELNSKFSKSMNKTYRERMLREQMKTIQEELDETEGKAKKKDYKQMIKEADLPEEIETIALEEAEKLKQLGPGNAETNVIRNYLDLILALPWHDEEVLEIDIEEARSRLNERHYGLDEVKDRIIQHLIVMKLKKNKQGSILLLVGPPGTGKTSLAKSIANALEREYIRISLGGIRDEAEIRGHRRTYIGALPGKIIQGMKRAGKKNPVFVLDEIDKLATSYQGDPASALLEVLDPEQNNSFTDHYLDAPYDLSDVFFIATANQLKGIPGPLLDRMELITIGSYTTYEKLHIAKKHLFPEVMEEHGFENNEIVLTEDAMKGVIGKYTREAGVRTLKRQLEKIIRVSSEKIVTGKVETPYEITDEMLEKILGHEIARYDMVTEVNPPGVVTGLAWTPVGGDILFIETALMPGKGNLLLTGQLGDVMKESAKISLTLVRSRLQDYIPQVEFEKQDLHIHVPAGATPKDGPSAGVTLFTAIASLVTGKAVDSKLAMTGEISLRGAVLPVGGIKEKILAAHRSGITKILLPYDNRKDLEDIPEEVKNDLTFVLIKRVEEVMKEALGIVIDPKNQSIYFEENHLEPPLPHM